MTAVFIICGCLFCAGIWATINALVKDAYNEGFRHGIKRGTYDACRQQVETEKFFRDIESASKTSFPHK